MESEVKIIIAFVFKRSGKPELKASDIYLTLSIELGWFSSQQAKNFVAYALQQSFLEKKKNMIIPTFDITIVSIPVGFRPIQQSYESSLFEKQENTTIPKEGDVFSALIQRISTKTGQSNEEIRKNIQQLQDKKQIYPEVAALILALTYSIRIDEYVEAVEVRLFKHS